MNAENHTNWVNNADKAHNVAKKAPSGPQKRPVSPQAAERMRRAAERRRRKRETFLIRLAFCAAIYLTVCLLIAGFVVSLYRGSTVSDDAARISVRDSEGNELCRLSAEESNVNGVEYISASALSKLYKFTLAGDKNEVTLHFHNINQSVSLHKDSAAVEISGESVRLGAKIIFTDDYYIPLELIENYFNGAIIKRDDDKGVITLSQNAEATFYLRLQLPQETVSAY